MPGEISDINAVGPGGVADKRGVEKVTVASCLRGNRGATIYPRPATTRMNPH